MGCLVLSRSGILIIYMYIPVIPYVTYGSTVTLTLYFESEEPRSSRNEKIGWVKAITLVQSGPVVLELS